MKIPFVVDKGESEITELGNVDLDSLENVRKILFYDTTTSIRCSRD